MPLLRSRPLDDVAREWVFDDMVVSDLAEVVAIERESFPNPWTGPLFLQELQVAFSRIILARHPAGAVAGYVCRWIVGDEVHVLNVAVDPRWRGQGLGSALMRTVLWEGRSHAADAVTLEVRRSNVAGRRLYESFGFEEVGSRPDYYGRGEDALILRLALRDG
jgi:[ribosomal protein S18]-alanine N-acetyltransferase